MLAKYQVALPQMQTEQTLLTFSLSKSWNIITLFTKESILK